MNFVPFVPYVPPPPPTPEAQELGRRLAETLELFKREHPGLRPFEIRQAMRLALVGQGGRGKAGIGLLVGALVALGIGGLLALRPEIEFEAPMPMVVLAMLLLGAVVVILIRKR